MTGILSAILCAATTALAVASPSRIERTINECWKFNLDGQEAVTVNVPHSWNAADCCDEVPGYFRGTGWYEKDVVINDNLDGRNVYVRFEGVGQVAELFVNGRSAGVHEGGYTAFIFDVTKFVREGSNQFRIRVDNSHNPDIPPLSADFTFFGGIYRDINLVITPENHISTTHYATSGVYVSTPEVAAEKAIVNLRTYLCIADKGQYVLEQKIISPDGKVAATVSSKIKLKEACDNLPFDQSAALASPVLWDIENPALYAVETTLRTSKGETVDFIRNSFGIRSFSFDPDKGFFLNGRHVKLTGTNRHQDFKDLANALPDEMHVRDVKLLKDMGGNFLRIAHYPQDPIVTGTCDRLGIVASVEIPIVNEITMNDHFKDICVNMAREMVYQDYNSPSVIIWAYMNEVLLRSPWTYEGAGFAKEEYFAELCRHAQAIDDAIKEADPLRYTMIPCDNNAKRYKESGAAAIPDILGFNIYLGWYGGKLEDFGPRLEELHGMFPTKPVILTEYGADCEPRLHSFEPERFDYTLEYGELYHEKYIPTILAADYIPGSNVWNINDFYSEARGFACPHVNNKGLTSLDRIPKDSYRLYQAWLKKEPFVMIGGHNWLIRGGAETVPAKKDVMCEGPVCVQPVKVYSNASSVTMYINGTLLGSASVNDRVAIFEVPFRDGVNEMRAVSSNGAEDFLRIDFQLVPEDMAGFTSMNVMLGTRRYFEDRPAGVVWIPEQKYREGSWGYVGGEMLRAKTSSSTRPTMENEIVGTDNDPLYQTQRVGLEAFRADVPDGTYYIYLHFAEITADSKGKPLPYNLGEDIVAEKSGERVFDVTINGVTVLKDFNIAQEVGNNYALVRKFVVDVNGGCGLNIGFEASMGRTALNAIRIYKAY